MEINFIIQILFQSITQEPGQQISSWIFAHFNDVICGSGVYAFGDIDMAIQPPQPPSLNPILAMPTPSIGKCSIGGSQIKASWRTELVSLNSRKRSSRYLTL